MAANANSGRLDKLEDQAIRTNGRLDAIEATQASHGAKLDGIGASLNNLAHSLVKYDSRPQFDLAKTVSVVRDTFAILAVLGSLAVWFVLTMTAANNQLTVERIARVEDRVTWMRDKFDWRPNLETTTPKGTP
jgi:hypothetical protein